MAAETKSGFLIEGTIYPMPELDSLNMGEAQILYDLSGITIEELAPAENETVDERTERVMARLRNPGFWRATMCIAYMRAHATVKTAQVVKLIDGINQLEARETLAGDDDQSEDPLALTTPPGGQSPSDPPTSNGSSGSDSQNGSDPPADPLARTGIGELDTSFPDPFPTAIS